MGKNTIITRDNCPPSYKKWADPQKRKEYLRVKNLENYHKRQALKKVSMPVVEDKTEVKIMENKNEVPADPLQAGLNGLKELSKGSDDPILQAIDKYGKYIPLVIQFMQGFTQAAAAHTPPQAAINQKIQAPDGWVGATPLQRLTRKFQANGELSEWYKAGLVYEGYNEGVELKQGVQSYQPVAMERTIHGQKQAQAQSMAELNKRSEQWDTKKSDDKPKTEQLQQEPQNVEITDDKKVLEEVKGELMEDNKKYLNLVMKYFESRDIKQFENDLKNAETTIKSFVSTWGLFIPTQTRALIKNTSIDDIEQMLKETSPEKHKLIVKKKLKDKFAKLWEELQNGV